MFGDIVSQIHTIITLYLYDIQCPLCGFLLSYLFWLFVRPLSCWWYILNNFNIWWRYCQIQVIEWRLRKIGDRWNNLYLYFYANALFLTFDGDKMDLGGRKVQRWSGVTAWSLNSGVRSASYRLRHSVLLGWVVSRREGRHPAAKMMKRTCSTDARGQTAIGHQEVAPTASYCAVQYTTLGQCVHTFFSPCLLMQGALFLPSRHRILKSCQKLEPEGESGGNER